MKQVFSFLRRSKRPTPLVKRHRFNLELLEDRLTPALPVTGAAIAAEGTPYAIVLGESTLADVTSYTVHWGDGDVETIPAAELPSDRTVTHAFADGPNRYSITVQATNVHGTFGAVPVAAYTFNDTLEGGNGVAALTPLLGEESYADDDTVLGTSRRVYQFSAANGLVLDTNGLIAPEDRDHYSVEVVFQFATVGDYRKFVDFANRQSDNGLYVTNSQVQLYQYDNQPFGDFQADTYYRVVLTHSDATDVASVYIVGPNGMLYATFSDPDDSAAIGNDGLLNFFTDDFVQGTEVSAGRVAQIRLFNQVLDADQVQELNFNTVNVAVENVVPALAALPDRRVTVDRSASFDLGSFTDTGDDSPWSVSVNWGDSSSDSFDVSSAGALGALEHTYTATGNFQVTVTVTDADGASHTQTFNVEVVPNTPPQDLVLNVDPAAGVEGGVVSLSGSFVDEDPGQAHSVSIAWGDGHQETLELAAGVFNFTVTHEYADNPAGQPEGSFTIHAVVTDPFDDQDSATAAVGVHNAAPVYTPAADQSGRVGQAGLIDLGSFSDLGAFDNPWAVTVHWGDGSSESFAVGATGALGQLSHTYDAAGTYTASVSVTDKDGASHSGSFEVTVSAGFLVTNTNDSGAGSLRQALQSANALPGLDVIAFQIGSGSQTITLNTPLPVITDAVVIDGWSQPGFSGAPLIRLAGIGSNGLVVSGGGSTVRGLSFSGFQTAVRLRNAGNNLVVGNSFGGGVAVTIQAPSAGNVVGTPKAPNTFADNSRVVIVSEGAVAAAHVTSAADGVLDVAYEGVVLGRLHQVPSVHLRADSIGLVNVAGTEDGDSFTVQAHRLTMNNVLIVGEDAAAWSVDGLGGADAFRVTATAAPFSLQGGAGADSFNFRQGGVNGAVNGGGDTDVLDYSGRSSAVEVNLATGAATATGGIAGIENARGGTGDDRLTGDALANVFSGGGGHDYLNGAAGDDVLWGGGGNDQLLGGAGSDTLNGEAGRDLLIGGLDADFLNGIAGDDVLIGGTTALDNNPAKLDELLAIWASSDDYDKRVQLITKEGYLSSKNVKDDGAANVLTGGSGRDLFFAGALDSITDFDSRREKVIKVKK